MERGLTFQYIFDTNTVKRLSLKKAKALLDTFRTRKPRGVEVQGGSPGLGRRNRSRNA
jgi:hypothetical protein